MIESIISAFNKQNKGKVRAVLKNKTDLNIHVEFIDAVHKKAIRGVYLDVRDISPQTRECDKSDSLLKTFCDVKLGCSQSICHARDINAAAEVFFKDILKCEALKPYLN